MIKILVSDGRSESFFKHTLLGNESTYWSQKLNIFPASNAVGDKII